MDMKEKYMMVACVRLPKRTIDALKKHVRSLDLNFTDAVTASIYFVLGLEGEDLRKFFVMAQDARLEFQRRWFQEGKELFEHVDGMQRAIEKAIKEKLIVESFKKKMTEPGSLRKIETCFEILENYNKKQITKIEAKKELAGITGK
ncbi:hypothetical protein ES708_21613 [subsurface metagenome]